MLPYIRISHSLTYLDGDSERRAGTSQSGRVSGRISHLVLARGQLLVQVVIVYGQRDLATVVGERRGRPGCGGLVSRLSHRQREVTRAAG